MRSLVLSANYSDRWNCVHEIFKQDLFDGKDVVFFGPGYPLWEERKYSAVALMSRFDADILFVFNSKNSRDWITDIELVKTTINYQVDYYPDRTHDSWRDNYITYNRFNIVIFPDRSKVDQFLMRNKSKKLPITLYLPHGVNTALFKPNTSVVKDINVAAIMSINPIEYPRRNDIFKVLSKSDIPNLFLHKVIKTSDAIPLDKYINFIQSSRVTLQSCDRYKSAAIKCFEVMACGSVLFSDEALDYTSLGFIDGVNYIKYSNGNLKAIPKILRRVLSDGCLVIRGRENLPLEQIAANGVDLICRRHTNKHRADKLWTFLKGVL